MGFVGIILLAGLALTVLLQLTPAGQRPKAAHWLPIVNAGVLALHLLLEGARWQLAPAYALALVALPGGISNLRYARRPWLAWELEDRPFLRNTGAALGALLLLDALFLLWVAPFFRPPPLGGPYPVGTRFYSALDPRREELFTAQPGDMRILSAQAWYPAAGREGRTQPYLEVAGQVSAAYARFLGMPFFTFSHLGHIPTHAIRDAPAHAGRFPVLIFSHAYDGNITQNTILMEQLASHGYIVFSLGHPYETPFVFDNQGQAILFKPDTPGRMARLAEMDDPIVGRIRDEAIAGSIPGGEQRLYEKLVSHTPLLLESLHTWSADIGAFVDFLERLDAADPVHDHLDLQRLGVFGHSLGGASAGQFCLVDPRCKAGLNMDGFQYGDMVGQNLQRPFLFMYSELPDLEDSKVNQFFYQQAKADAYSLVIRGFDHQAFSDMPFYFRDYRIEQRLRQVEPVRGVQIVTAYTLAFFDRYLKGRDSPLLHGDVSAFPEVLFEMRAP